ncbi:MAG: putative glycoside hydrolase [Anaerolineae bacterium]|nr:putative glycoside hydrolase family 15 protein [Thermoflexales bacterium]MDW8395036.1 putative glycoside hydrolase [Anaerolineae bacterium]
MRSACSLRLASALALALAVGCAPAALEQGAIDPIPSPVAFVPAAPLPQPTPTATPVPLPTATPLPPTPVPKALPVETTKAIGLWSDRLSDAESWQGFLDLAVGKAALEYQQRRNPLLVTLAQAQVYAGAPELRESKPDWLLYDRNKRPALASADNASPLLDIRKEEVRAYLAEQVASALAEGPFQGVILSNVGEDLIRTNATPVFTGTRGFTEDQRRDAVEGLLRAIRAKTPDRLLIIGGYAWRDGTAYAASPSAAQQLATFADGVHIEAFLRSPISKTNEFKPEAAWKRDVDYLSAISQDDKVVLVTTRLPAGTPTDLAQQWLRYSVASYLLGKNGAHTYFQFDAGDPVLSNDPYLSAPIGSPAGAYVKLDSGVYLRRFSNGVAMVNPTGEQKRAALDGSYKTLQGNTVDVAVTLGPRTGIVLLKP